MNLRNESKQGEMKKKAMEMEVVEIQRWQQQCIVAIVTALY